MNFVDKYLSVFTHLNGKVKVMSCQPTLLYTICVLTQPVCPCSQSHTSPLPPTQSCPTCRPKFKIPSFPPMVGTINETFQEENCFHLSVILADFLKTIRHFKFLIVLWNEAQGLRLYIAKCWSKILHNHLRRPYQISIL